MGHIWFCDVVGKTKLCLWAKFGVERVSAEKVEVFVRPIPRALRTSGWIE